MPRGLAVLLAVVFAWSCVLIGPAGLRPDERQNLFAGYNMATYGVASVSVPDGGPPAPDMRREPAYPFVLSLALGPGEPDLQCLIANDLGCSDRALVLRATNVILVVVVAGLTFALARQFVSPKWAYASAAASGFSPALVGYSGLLLTEPAAAALILAGTYGLVRMVRADTGQSSWALCAGAAFGLLVLVKSLFLFVVPAVIVVLMIGRGPRRATAVRSALVLCMAALIVAPWSIRNAVQMGSYLPSSGGTNVLAVRAESMSMTGKEYLSSFVYFTGLGGPHLAKLIFGEQHVLRHDRSNPEGFFRQAIDDDGVAREERPLAVIRQQPLRYLALTLPFAWQGAFGTDPLTTSPPNWWPEPLRQTYLGLAALGVLLRWASFAAFFLIVVRARRNGRLLALVAPAGLLFAAYAVTSHFIPRYGAPLLPVTYVCLAICAQHFSRGRASGSMVGARASS